MLRRYARPVNDVLNWILDTVQNVDPVLRTLLAGVGMFLETSILVGLVVPGDSIVIVASTAVDGPVQFIALASAVIIGSLGGESLGFALGRYFGPRIRGSRLGARVGEKNWIRAERYLARRGGVAVFISRFLPVLHSLIPLTVGMSGMTYRRFIRWTAPACVLWALAYSSIGALAAGSFREMSATLHGAGYLFVGIVAAGVILILVGKKLIEKRESRHMEHDDAPAPDERLGEH